MVRRTSIFVPPEPQYSCSIHFSHVIGKFLLPDNIMFLFHYVSVSCLGMGRLSADVERKRIRQRPNGTCPFIKNMDTGFALN